MLRAQLPVRTPVTLRSVWEACLPGADPLGRVRALLMEEYAPAALALTGSGTAALAAAMRLAAGPRPRIALPAYICYDLATAADMVDAEVLLYDLDPETLGPDWDSFNQALAAGARGVVVAHLYGVPVDMEEALRHAAEHGATVIEDAAQGVGGSWRGRPLGANAPLAVLSFGRGKGRTGGHGGALLAHTVVQQGALEQLEWGQANETPADVARLFAQWLLARPSVYGALLAVPGLGLGETTYRPPGPIDRMGRRAAAALAANWPQTAQENLARHRHAMELEGAMAEAPLFASIRVPDGGVGGYLRYPVIWRGSGPAPFGATARSYGIMPGYPASLADLDGFRRRLVVPDAPMQGARRLARTLGTLPTHGLLTARDRGRLLEWLVAPHGAP